MFWSDFFSELVSGDAESLHLRQHSSTVKLRQLPATALRDSLESAVVIFCRLCVMDSEVSSLPSPAAFPKVGTDWLLYSAFALPLSCEV